VAFGTVFLMGYFSFSYIGFDECYSLWSSTDRSLGMYVGLQFPNVTILPYVCMYTNKKRLRCTFVSVQRI